jgi:hypothetical protein
MSLSPDATMYAFMIPFVLICVFVLPWIGLLLMGHLQTKRLKSKKQKTFKKIGWIETIGLIMMVCFFIHQLFTLLN